MERSWLCLLTRLVYSSSSFSRRRGLDVEYVCRAGCGNRELARLGLTDLFLVCGVEGMCWSWLCWVDELAFCSNWTVSREGRYC